VPSYSEAVAVDLGKKRLFKTAVTSKMDFGLSNDQLVYPVYISLLDFALGSLIGIAFDTAICYKSFCIAELVCQFDRC
jgi:hypothetical protein